MGGGGTTYTPSSLKPLDEIKAEVKRPIDEIKYRESLKEVKETSKKVMDEKTQDVKWNLTDHSFRHAERVKENVDSLLEVLDDISITRNEVGDFLSDSDKFKLDSSAYLHDVGRGEEDHATSSGKFVRENKHLFSDEDEAEKVAELCELHNDPGTENAYGESDLSELRKKGLINEKTAFQASILRIADAMDATEKRVRTNTQGDPKGKVIDRILAELPLNEIERELNHWYGHEGIRECYAENRNGKLTINFEIDHRFIDSYGYDIAFKANDTLKDFNGTVFKKYEVAFKCENEAKLEKWYYDHQEILTDQIKKVKVHLER